MASDPYCPSVEHFTGRRRIAPGRRINNESIAGKARDDMEVGVEDLPFGGLAIGHEEVDAFGSDGIGMAVRDHIG